MLYILVFTRVSYHFDCCMIFDVVLVLLLPILLRKPCKMSILNP